MEDKLVTLAIRTYQRAKMIQTVLEEKGIATHLHNLNEEQPDVALGVRIRIKESDLPMALQLVETIEEAWNRFAPNEVPMQILIPIDFTDATDKQIEFGFQLAEKKQAEVVLMNVYFTPTYTISVQNDINTYSLSDLEQLRRIIAAANADIENMKNKIERQITEGSLPDVPYNFILKEGIPEDQILEYCKKEHPALVVMGTKGKNKDPEVIGSVTAEVIEAAASPVLTIPINMGINNVTSVKRIAFLTNFDQNDLQAIDKTVKLFQNDNLEIYFIHVSEKNQEWDEIILAGIKSYFANHYPSLNANYELIDSPTHPDLIENFVHEKNIDLLAFNSRRRKLFSRLFNPGLAYKMVLNSTVPLFVTHV